MLWLWEPNTTAAVDKVKKSVLRQQIQVMNVPGRAAMNGNF